MAVSGIYANDASEVAARESHVTVNSGSRSTRATVPVRLTPSGAQVFDGLGGGFRGDAGGEVEQDPGGEAGPRRVRGGRVHAVVGGDAYHVDLVHAARRAASRPAASRPRRRPRTRCTPPHARPSGTPPPRPRCPGSGGSRPPACPPRSAAARRPRSPDGRRNGRPGPRGSPWSPPRARSRDRLARRSLIARATAAPPATASEPPSQKSFCTSTMISARMGPTVSYSPTSAGVPLVMRMSSA